MDTEKAVIIKIISHLLQYPDEFLHPMLDRYGRLLQELPPDHARSKLETFLNYLRDCPLISLQQEYCQHFDFSSATSLYLTYHRYGDGKERGAALAELQQLYLQSGFFPITRELPDFLPLMLEFMSVCPKEALERLVKAYQPQIEGLAERLFQAQMPYAILLELAVASLRDLSPDSNA